MTATVATPPRDPIAVKWYRSPVARDEMKHLLTRSDLRGFAQTLPHLLFIALSGTATYLALMQPAAWFGTWSFWGIAVAAPFLLLHGFFCSFAINAVHELGHGTVFRHKWLNRLFEHVFAFIGWINHDQFTVSHTRHHRYTLHFPDDQEVVLPQRFATGSVWHGSGIFDWRVPKRWFDAMRFNARVAAGRAGFDGPWNSVLFPTDQPGLRRAIRRWALVLVLGHGAVLAVSIACGWWALPLVVSLAPHYGTCIQRLMNSTQHIGMMKEVGDARLCCRTFTAHPFLQYLYWHMNYHIEHHMFAAVPCYRLGRLHRTISTDLPPTTHGIRATWRGIDVIQERQRADPLYQEMPAIPQPTALVVVAQRPLTLAIA